MGREYGWTPDYILNSLSKKEIFKLVGMVNLRYRAERLAMEKARNESGSGSKKPPNIGDLNPSQMKEFGIMVNK